MDYREAGVDVAAGRAFVDRIRDRVRQTYRPEVLGQLGSFGGCFALPAGYREPVLVSGTDGVGTKLALAQAANCHDTVGIDLVAMCANDVLACGAEPLFFLDYAATGKLDPEVLAGVVAGVAAGCEAAGCALLGGETAEMPGFYEPGKYDLAGFCVGIAEKSEILDGSRVQAGDAIVALGSSGLHSNGFSLVRKIAETLGLSWQEPVADLGPEPLGQVLLAPTQIYAKPVLEVLRGDFDLHGLAHITGGGLPENLPRGLGPGQSARLDPASWTPPAVFRWLAAAGEVDRREMFATFNMGVGMTAMLPPDRAEAAIARWQEAGLNAWVVGEVVPGEGEVLGL